MRKFFVVNIIFLILVNLIVKPVWIFGIDRNVQNLVGHAAYGQYQAILSFSIIFQIFLDFGLQNYNNRTVAQSPEMMRRLFPNILWSKAILSIAYFILLFSFGYLIGFRGYALWLLLLLGIVQVLTSLLLYLRSNVSAMHKFKTDSLLSVFDKLLMIIICGYLLYFSPWQNNFTIEWFIYAQITAYLLTAAIAFFTCTRLTRLNWQRFDLKRVLIVCKQSLPYAILIFSMAVYLRSDSVLLERLLPNGKEQAGIFAASFRLLDAANNMTGVLFAGILLPMFGRLLAKRQSVRPLVHQSLNLILPVALTTVALSFFLGNDIMQLLYKDMTGFDVRVFPILMCALPGFSIGYVYATLLTANGNLRPLIYISVIAVIFNLSLNFILIPKYGAIGAAVCCAATQILVSVLNIWLSTKILHLKTNLKWVGQYLLFAVLMTGLGALIYQTEWPLLIKVAAMGVDGLISMAVCGFLPIQKLIHTFKLPDKKN